MVLSSRYLAISGLYWIGMAGAAAILLCGFASGNGTSHSWSRRLVFFHVAILLIFIGPYTSMYRIHLWIAVEHDARLAEWTLRDRCYIPFRYLRMYPNPAELFGLKDVFIARQLPPFDSAGDRSLMGKTLGAAAFAQLAAADGELTFIRPVRQLEMDALPTEAGLDMATEARGWIRYDGKTIDRILITDHGDRIVGSGFLLRNRLLDHGFGWLFTGQRQEWRAFVALPPAKRNMRLRAWAQLKGERGVHPLGDEAALRLE